MRNAPSGLRLDWIERWLWMEVCRPMSKRWGAVSCSKAAKRDMIA